METLNFKTVVFGDNSLSMWAGYCTIFLIGVLIQYLLKTRNRTYKHTIDWSWTYFILDNWRKVLLVILMMYAAIRFYLEIAPYLQLKIPTGFKITEAFAIIVLGLLIQKVIDYLSKKVGVLKYNTTAQEFQNKN